MLANLLDCNQSGLHLPFLCWLCLIQRRVVEGQCTPCRQLLLVAQKRDGQPALHLGLTQGEGCILLILHRTHHVEETDAPIQLLQVKLGLVNDILALCFQHCDNRLKSFALVFALCLHPSGLTQKAEASSHLS